MEDQAPVEIQVSAPDGTRSGNTRRNTGLAAAFLTMLLLLIAIAAFGVQKIQDTKKSETSPNDKYKPLANSTLVYGYWTNQSSVISALDLASGKEATLATLGRNVKHIRIINNHTISYIKDTDQHDYGAELTLRDIEKNTDSTIIKADKDFGIDDYTISPNGNYAALWEVGIGIQNQFSGSPSRVYTVDITNKSQHLIYDETTANSNPVHYPIAITDGGTLFSDRFLPNSGAGWAYGMSTSDFSGSKKSEITSMKNGTYGTQPEVSPDGKYLGFAGYSGSDGTKLVEGYRKALAEADTIELLDLQSLERIKVATGLTNAIYASVFWDTLTNNLLFKTIQKQSDTVVSSTYSYSPRLAVITKMQDVPKLDFFADFSEGKYLMGQKFQDNSGIGNLGYTYSQSVNKFYVVNSNDLSQNAISISHQPIQLVAIKPNNYFPLVEKSPVVNSNFSQQLGLQTFEIKPSLAPQRSEQQSEPVPVPQSPTAPPVDLPQCRTISYPQCNALLGTSYPTSKDLGDLDDKAFSDCVWGVQQVGEANSTCLDSPLYLYGKNGTNVKVVIDTHTNNSNVQLANNSFTAILNDGKISVGSNLVDSISYDYESRITKLIQPTTGFIFKKENIANDVEKVASQFGLNFRESQDLLNFAKKIFSPYIFVSFYDQATSQNILPLYFDPKPDNFRNIVFYFKKLDFLPLVIPNKPIIEPIIRTGFTAIEISYITE